MIDVDAAFSPEKRQEQAEMGIYEDNRPGLNEAGIAVGPNGNVLPVPEGIDPDATQEEINKAATNAYFDEQREIADAHSPAHKKYEDMSTVELASKLGEAEYYGDKTIEQDIGDILLDRLEVEEEKIKDDTYFREGEPMEALWSSVMSIAEKKKDQLKKQHGDNESADAVQSPNVPYDWDAENSFGPFQPDEPVDDEPDGSGPQPSPGPGGAIPDSVKVAEHPKEDGSYEIELILKQDPRFTPERVDALKGVVDPAWQERKENGENQVELTEYLGSYAEGGMDSLEEYMKSDIKKHIWQYRARDGEVNILTLDQVAFPLEKREQLKELGIHLDEAGMLLDIDPAPSKPEPQTQTSPEMPPPDEPPEDHESKEKGLRIEVGFAEEALKGEDTIVVNEEMGVFGVFDGLGGMGRGDEASKAAAEALENMYARRARENEYPQDVQTAIDDAKFVLAEARLKASQTGGHTTAVFAKLEKINGKDYLIWANAGDSRMIMRKADGTIVDISTDQSEGNIVKNQLGPSREGPYDKRTLMPLDEFGSIELQPDDRVMLCSDGITGDWDFQFLSQEEFEDGFSKRTAQESAARFMELSKKDDDKSVIVIDAVAG